MERFNEAQNPTSEYSMCGSAITPLPMSMTNKFSNENNTKSSSKDNNMYILHIHSYTQLNISRFVEETVFLYKYTQLGW